MFYTLVFADCTHGVKDQSEMQSLQLRCLTHGHMSHLTSAAVFNRYRSFGCCIVLVAKFNMISFFYWLNSVNIFTAEGIKVKF